jgi:hypothetical protein
LEEVQIFLWTVAFDLAKKDGLQPQQGVKPQRLNYKKTTGKKIAILKHRKMHIIVNRKFMHVA